MTPETNALTRGKHVSENELASFQGWFPVAIEDGHDAPPQVWWRHVGNRRFTEPFFEDTLARMPTESRRTCCTPIEALTRFEEGDCSYLRLSDPHTVANRGATDRVHLVGDASLNRWLTDMMTSAHSPW